MENASKALIMAGAILIAIMIVSLVVLIFNRFGGAAKEAANMDEQEIANFNSKITPYIGNSISGSQVNALIQYIISVNTSAANTGDTIKIVTIKYPADINGTTTNCRIKVEGGQVKFSPSNCPKRVNTGPRSYYEVTATYSDGGLINTVTVKTK